MAKSPIEAAATSSGVKPDGEAQAATDKAKADAEAQAAADKAKADQDEGDEIDFTGKTLAVRSVSQAGRRRAGRSFGSEPVELLADELSADEISLLLADDFLIVELR